MTPKAKKILIIVSVIILTFVIFLIMSKPTNSIQNNNDPNVTLNNGIQIVKMTESAQGYLPNYFTITKGIPVRWEIEANTDRTCANALLLPDYKIREFLIPGKNVIIFTPNKLGKIPFSCSMKMYTGTFNVIE